VRLLPIPGVFRPHSDSLQLAERVRRERFGPGSRALDLCTGSGVLALAAAQAGAAEVFAVDVSRRAVLAARLNALINGLRVRALRGDLFAAVGDRRFDLIVSNPPYVPTPEGELPKRGPARAWEGGSDGRALIERICAAAPRHLRPGGVLLLVHSAFCGEADTLAALAAGGLEAEVVERHRGGLGKRVAERERWMRERGLLGDDGVDEVLIVRAQQPS
jgi:release factor glutamine methyltransferase